MLMEPLRSILSPNMSAFNQAPWPIAVTPGNMRGVTFAGMSICPFWLKTRTVSPC